MLKYYREVDSLRALAVIAVIINHFEKSWLTGGFLGVDIFFVISGFVVTASLKGKETQNLKSYLQNFYKRRIKRLYPSLVTCIFLFSIPIFFLFEVNDVYIKTGFNALFGLSNFYLLQEASNYFSISSETNIFTHTWSLGVEEQFYLFFPLLYYIGKRKNLLNVFLLFGVLLSVFFFLINKNSLVSFYMMPSRFWQFSLGALVYLIPFNGISKINKHLIIFPLIGIFLTLIKTSKFNFISAALVSIFTATSLLFIKRGEEERSYLTNKWALKTGLASYSLYLYHWPILVLFKQTVSVDKTKGIVALALMILLSFLSYSLIENKLRKNKWTLKQKISFFSIFFLALLFKFDTKKFSDFLYLGVPKENYSFYNNPSYNEKLIKRCTHRSSEEYKLPSYESFLSEYFDHCKIEKGEKRNIYVLGNSHAQEKAPSFIWLSRDLSSNLYYYTKSGMKISYPDKEAKTNSEALTKYYFDALMKKGKKGDIAILSIALLNLENSEFLALQSLLEKKTRELKTIGVTLYFIDGYPALDETIEPVNCYQNWSYNAPNCNIDKIIDKNGTKKVYLYSKTLRENKNIHFIYIFDAIKVAHKKVERPLRLYRDSNHLSHFGNEFIYPVIKESILKNL